MDTDYVDCVHFPPPDGRLGIVLLFDPGTHHSTHPSAYMAHPSAYTHPSAYSTHHSAYTYRRALLRSVLQWWGMWMVRRELQWTENQNGLLGRRYMLRLKCGRLLFYKCWCGGRHRHCSPCCYWRVRGRLLLLLHILSSASPHE